MIDFRRILAGAGLMLLVTWSCTQAGQHPKPGQTKEKSSQATAPPTPKQNIAEKAPIAPKHKCQYSTQDCLNHMASRLKASGWIGIEYEPADSGVITVQRVVPGSPAEKAGLAAGDVLYSINGVEIRKGNDEAMKKAKVDYRPGQTIHYVVKRNGAPKPIDIVLGQWPADLLAKYIGEHMLEHAEADALAQTSPK
jgi:predicted metalloprotease with PDZ domain